MLTFGQSILIAIISSGIAATIVGSFFTYFANNKLDRRQRVMDMRKKIYSETHEELAGFFDNATIAARQKASTALLILYRQILLWGSVDVIKQFNKFWDVFDEKNGKTQEDTNKEYTNLIIEMRKDLTGENIMKKDVRRYGKIN
jgi:hypothetical protein